MPQFIVHLADHFLIWSTVPDAPITFGMTREEFKEYYRDEYGRQGCMNLEERLDRAVATGSSVMPRGKSALEVIRGNHAGPDGAEISLDEIIRYYVTEKRDPRSSEEEEAASPG